jgi:hypothetical protein
MANLRLQRIKTSGNRRIIAEFTDPLISTIGVGNVDVSPILSSIPKPQVLFLNINDNILDITVQPLTPLAEYKVEFKSTQAVRFKSTNGNFLFEDGKTNVPVIQGPDNPPNSIKNALIKYLDDQIYNLDGTNTVSKLVESQAKVLSRALHDIGQAANDNYLEHTIIDEQKTRGAGPFDRLNQEGAFEVTRVGLTETSYPKTLSFSYSSFPKDIITLKRTNKLQEELSAGSGVGTFNNILLTVRKKPVTKLTSLIIRYEDGYTSEYNISKYGYRLQNPIYDTNYASTLLTLETNQIQLNEEVFGSELDPPGAGDTVVVSYEYKSLGRQIDEDSVVVSKVVDAIREVTPPIITEFSLEHAPVVTAQDNIAEISGVQFLDPRSCVPFSETHPAFTKELPYRLEGLPSSIGEYSVDYENGRVFVYGEETNDGTGNYPPVATYKYRSSFNSDLDYTYNPETGDLAASPLRELVGQNVKVTFDYEEALVPDIDYNANVHVEIIDERIDNRLTSLISLRTTKTPITNVFRVINETSGEIYPVNRFNDSTVFFSTNTPPKITDITRERASFTNVLNEILVRDSEITNASNVSVFKISLLNNNIIGASEDLVGASFNSSVEFSRTDIFSRELYFDGQVLSETANVNKLSVGDYAIDYQNGIVYVGVTANHSLDVGTINYKAPRVKSNNKHIISVSRIYHSLDPNNNMVIDLNYSTFSDTEITPTTFELADERFINNNTSRPILYINGNITVNDNVKSVGGIFDAYDLNNNDVPTNFSNGATFSGNVITVSEDGVNKQQTASVSAGNIISLPVISAGMNISAVNSVIRVSDGVELWDSFGTFTGFEITLSGVGSPVPGDIVAVNYQVSLNGGSTPVVNYNRGDYYIDYSYLSDEILVSYEYGDNVIDFRESNTVDEDTEYFVTYKVGSLRDSLFTNFGSLVDLPVMSSFDTSFNRERYRDSLQGALQSFTKGPTIPSMKLLVSNITKIDPEIIESVFEVWSLGIGSLYQDGIEYLGDPTLVDGKFDNGILLDSSNQSVSMPLNNHLRLEDGSLEFWIIPEWDGLDNDATLTFSELKLDGYVVSAENIWIGSRSHHPTFDSNGNFSVSRFDSNDPKGLPSAIFSQTGVFIYYDDDIKRWRFLVKNNVDKQDGYAYSGKILTSGEFYDVKFIEDLGEPSDTLRSLTNEVQFILNINYEDASSPDGYTTGDGYMPGTSFDGISFMSDDLHYFIDAADPASIPTGLNGTIQTRVPHPAEIEARKRKSKNRFSIYKDGRGFLNFEVYDSNSSLYKVSADISDWSAGEKHLIGTSWKINSFDRRDEIHLFVDGFEVPNILRYGGRPKATIGDRFREVKPELVVGSITSKILKGDDLNTVYGSSIVLSPTVNFQSEGIVAGDTIDILEVGFGTFNILSVTGNSLLLDSPVPATFTDARFSTNVFSAIVSNEVDLSANIAVSILDTSGTETEIPGLRADFPSYSVDKNAQLQTVFTLYGPANVGDQVLIRTLGLNHRRCRSKAYLWGDTQSILKTRLPPPISLDEVKIRSLILPLLSIGPDNSTIVAGQFVASGIVPTSVSNQIEGRELDVRITGGNVNFSTPVQVQITGTSDGPGIETLSFSTPEIQTTANRWRTITDITVTVTPVTTASRSIAVEIKETLSVTEPGLNNIFPIIRFSYQEDNGDNLSHWYLNYFDNIPFKDTDVGKKIVVTSPVGAAGTYEILARVNDDGRVAVSPTPPINFDNGKYTLYNTTIGRSGFQNGFFTFELAGSVNTPYPLPQGHYEFDYSAWLEIPFANVEDHKLYIGSDFMSTNQARAVIDELRILSKSISDVRVGESSSSSEKSFTADYVALRPFEPDSETITLIHFDELPLINEGTFYKISNKEFLQSDNSINSEFKQSIVITERPYVVDNNGKLSTRSEGTIEFWVSPRYDTYNDPVTRFYFDAAGAVTETVTSLTAGTVKIAGRANEIISVRLATDTNETGIDFYTNGTLLNDRQTIRLGLSLPSTQTPVVVTYVPSGFSGDRISIYKDDVGLLTFNVTANGTDFQVKQPIFWQRDTWHRVFVSFKFNRRDNRDELRMFIDGREASTISFGQGFLFGQGLVFGQGQYNGEAARLTANIDFVDVINQFFIGSTFRKSNLAAARFDNLKISNISRPPLLCSGIPVDENYQSNLSVSLPVVTDLYTLYLANFDQTVAKNEDFAILRDEEFGIFNFIINVIDSFRIVENDAKVDQVLRELIIALKPANSKAEINVIR